MFFDVLKPSLWQSVDVLQPRSLSQVMHGGLFSEDGVTLEDLRKIERNRQPPDSGRIRLWEHQQRTTVSNKTSVTCQHLPALFHRSHVWPPLVGSTASGQLLPVQYLKWLISNISTDYLSVTSCWLIRALLSLLLAERPVNQQAWGELPVRAGCDWTFPGAEQAGLHCS